MEGVFELKKRIINEIERIKYRKDSRNGRKVGYHKIKKRYEEVKRDVWYRLIESGIPMTQVMNDLVMVFIDIAVKLYPSYKKTIKAIDLYGSGKEDKIIDLFIEAQNEAVKVFEPYRQFIGFLRNNDVRNMVHFLHKNIASQLRLRIERGEHHIGNAGLMWNHRDCVSCAFHEWVEGILNFYDLWGLAFLDVYSGYIEKKYYEVMKSEEVRREKTTTFT